MRAAVRALTAGSGAAPVVARLAKEQGSLVVAIVSEPFEFEGKRRAECAAAAVAALRQEGRLGRGAAGPSAGFVEGAWTRGRAW